MYIYSTMTNDVAYVEYSKSTDERQQKRPIKTILIKGGHDRVTYTKNGGIDVPMGVRTEIDDKDFEFLKQNISFRRHEKAGFISYDNKKIKSEKKVLDMKERDRSAQLKASEYDESNSGDSNSRVYKVEGAIQ